MTLLRYNNAEFASTLFHAGNNAGEGYAACGCDVENCGCDIDAIDGIGKLLLASSETNGLAVYQTAGGVTIVGDANGPWAVDADFHDLAALQS